MNVNKTPPLTVTVGSLFSVTFRIEDSTATVPVFDLTGYSATYSIAEKTFETPFKTGSCTVTATNRIALDLTADETALFTDYALPIIGGRPSAILQIDVTAPTEANSLVLQGPLIIAGTF